MPNYRRSPDELRHVASLFWPEELSKRVANLSVVPKLIETHDDFIAILSVRVPKLENLFDVIAASSFPTNLFLKHLVVLADFGGEMLQRVNNEFDRLFPDHEVFYWWQSNLHQYQFRELPIKGNLTNSKLWIDGKRLLHVRPFDDLAKDVIALLLIGGASNDNHTAGILTRCEISNYLGQPDKLQQFIKQRYIWVSQITRGATTNALGQEAQNFVHDYLEDHLQLEDFTIATNAVVPGVRHTDATSARETTFDIVVTNGSRYVAIEVTFQVTTNSVIERKAGQAKARYERMEANRHRIAYVIDGAGNFQRETAMNTLCSFSHCTVAFSTDELDVLCQFIEAFLSGQAD